MYISHTTIKQSARSMANDMTQTLTQHSILFPHCDRFLKSIFCNKNKICYLQ